MVSAHCFQFLLGVTVVPREIQDIGYTNHWRVNKVHYGPCENGEYVNMKIYLEFKQ